MKMALENPWVGLISKSSKETTKLPAEKWLKSIHRFPLKNRVQQLNNKGFLSNMNSLKPLKDGKSLSIEVFQRSKRVSLSSSGPKMLRGYMP